jgi:Na+-driven multidrug efflux pump
VLKHVQAPDGTAGWSPAFIFTGEIMVKGMKNTIYLFIANLIKYIGVALFVYALLKNNIILGVIGIINIALGSYLGAIIEVERK